MYCGRAASGRRCQKKGLGVPVLSTNTFDCGSAGGCSCDSGGKDWPNTTIWRASLGPGRASTGQWSKRPWRKKRSVRIQLIGGKKGSKRSLLVDAIGIPLSIVASGAQVHDVKLLEPTLDQIVTERPPVQTPPKENLCADKAYSGEPARKAIEKRHYVPHVRQRGEEIAAKRRNPRSRARRWVVERTHSWLNRYRKLLVRFEKTALSFEGLLELACALIVFRRVIVIYG
jgi:transposase